MNTRLSFVSPKIDYNRRNYSAGVQDLLDAMVQRDPKKRSTLNQICRMPIVSQIFQELVKEEAEFDT